LFRQKKILKKLGPGIGLWLLSTTWGIEADTQRCPQVPMNGFLAKPVRLNQLRKTVQILANEKKTSLSAGLFS